jgi:Ca2+-binding RTX toxin-like protein
MATFTWAIGFSGRVADMTAMLGGLGRFELLFYSPTRGEYFGSGGESFRLLGTGLQGSFDTGLTGGRLTELLAHLGIYTLQISQMDLPAPALWRALDANDTAAVRAILTGGDDRFIGKSGDDRMAAGAGRDVLDGFAGNDALRGDAGDDRLRGGTGADTLTGGSGRDTLTGGDGQDRFVFATAPAPGLADRITDFDRTADVIALDAAVLPGLGPAGGLAASRFARGTAARDEGDRLIYDIETGVLSFDRDGTGAAAAIRLAVLLNTPALDHTDFVIF